MKAYKYEIVIIDFDEMGQEEISRTIENMRFLSPTILSKQVADIGEWSEDHPANKKETYSEYYSKIFIRKGCTNVV